MLIGFLVAGIFIAVVFGKGGVNLVKSCLLLTLGAACLLVAGALI